jgi:hypothetical protein
MTKSLKEFYRPGQPNPDVVSRKELFAGLNEFVTKRSGWLTSVPGERDVTMETLEGSGLPDAIRALGYDVTATGEGQRILANAIVEKFTTRADGEFEPLVEGSTKPIASTVTHAGIVKVKRYSFEIP